MKVDRVGVSLIYSEDAGHGRKTVELKAEGIPDFREGETWQQAMADLNHNLGLTMRGIWREYRNNLQPLLAVPVEQTPLPATRPPEQTPPPADPNWCAEHRKPFKPRENKETHQPFRSHYVKETSTWCNKAA